MNMCGKVRHAEAAVDAGCDVVIAKGTEAGGHTGTVATMPLVPQIVDAVGDRVPVVAAGGSFDGRGRSEEHTSELQSLMRTSYAVFCSKKKKKHTHAQQSHMIISDQV